MTTGSALPGRLLVIGGALLIAAWVSWTWRDFLPSLFTVRAQATAKLATVAERDDARVNRAFQAALRSRRADATLEPLVNATKVRNSLLSVRASSGDEALEELKAMTDAIQAAFAAEGPGALDVNASRKSTAVPNGASVLAGEVLRWGTLALVLAGIALIVLAWRVWRSGATERLPRELVLAMLVPIGITTVYILARSRAFEGLGVAIIVMPIPLLIAALTVYKSLQFHKAARWSEGRARITRSQMEVQRHRHASDTTQVANVPAIEYEFPVGAETHEGSRIAIAEIVDAEAVLQRFPVGAVVPVYYNPADPGECVLDRSAPLPQGVIWAIAVVALLAGAAATYAILNLDGIDESLRRYLPEGGQPVFTIVFGGCGLFMLMLLWAQWRQASAAAHWPVAEGRIVASGTESFQRRVGGARTGQLVTFHKAVVEYAYAVNGREYHGARLNFGGEESTGEGPAKAKAVRYPVGQRVQVRYDPANPSNAVLEIRVAFSLLLLAIAALFVGLAIRFSGIFG